MPSFIWINRRVDSFYMLLYVYHVFLVCWYLVVHVFLQFSSSIEVGRYKIRKLCEPYVISPLCYPSATTDYLLINSVDLRLLWRLTFSWFIIADSFVNKILIKNVSSICSFCMPHSYNCERFWKSFPLRYWWTELWKGWNFLK